MGNVTGMRKCAGCGVTLRWIFVAQRGCNERYYALGHTCPNRTDDSNEAVYVLMSVCIHVERDECCNTYHENHQI